MEDQSIKERIENMTEGQLKDFTEAILKAYYENSSLTPAQKKELKKAKETRELEERIKNNLNFLLSKSREKAWKDLQIKGDNRKKWLFL